MNKLLTLLFIAIPIIVWAWCNNDHEYKLTFLDKRVSQPIYTKSYSDNWKDSCHIYTFYFNQVGYMTKNIESATACGCRDLIKDSKAFGYSKKYDGYIVFKDVDKIEMIK